MGTTLGSAKDPERSGLPIPSYYKTAMNANASTRLPYVLSEAMVNHKKMVHPPN